MVIDLNGNTLVAWKTPLPCGLPCGLQMCSNLAFICISHLQKMSYFCLGRRYIIIRAPSPRVLFNGLSQTPHVSLRGWSTKKGRFFYMVCPVTFIDTCSMASLDQSRVTSIGCIPDGVLPFLNYPSDFS